MSYMCCTTAHKYKSAAVWMNKTGIKCASGSSGDIVQTSPLEANPQEPLEWGTAKHLTLSSARPHSSHPFLFVFRSIPAPLPSHHLSRGLVPPLFLLHLGFFPLSRSHCHSISVFLSPPSLLLLAHRAKGSTGDQLSIELSQLCPL